MPDTIVVTKRLPQSALARLSAQGDVVGGVDRAPMSRDALLRAIAGASAVVTSPLDAVDAELLAAAGPRLRCVANVAVGHDNIDLAAATSRRVQVTNTPSVLTEATADLAFTLLLAVTRRIGEAERLVRRGGAWDWDYAFLTGMGLQGKTLGVVGLGAIGSAVARRARAFGMSIIYATDVPIPGAVVDELQAQEVPLERLVSDSDVITLHCPLTTETTHLVNAAFLARMKSSAFLINAARGPIVDEDALVDALRAGVIAGAGLDVFEHEPAVHPGLLSLDTAFLLPHIGSATIETRTAMADLAAENVTAVLGGHQPPNPVNRIA